VWVLDFALTDPACEVPAGHPGLCDLINTTKSDLNYGKFENHHSSFEKILKTLIAS